MCISKFSKNFKSKNYKNLGFDVIDDIDYFHWVLLQKIIIISITLITSVLALAEFFFLVLILDLQTLADVLLPRFNCFLLLLEPGWLTLSNSLLGKAR